GGSSVVFDGGGTGASVTDWDNIQNNPFSNNTPSDFASQGSLPKSLAVVDVRYGDFPNSDGTAGYVPAPDEPHLNQSVTPIFSQDWAGAGYGGILTVKGWNETYAGWQIAGTANNGPSDQWFLRSGGGTSWGTSHEILHTGNSDKFNSSGDYANLRVRVMIKGDVGLGDVPNWSSSFMDSRFINASGDSMTGDLYMGANYLYIDPQQGNLAFEYGGAVDDRQIIRIHDDTSALIDELRYDNDEFLFPNGLRTGGTLSSDKVDVTGKITAKNADFTDRVKFLVNPSSNISVPYPSGASAFSVADNSGV